MIYLQVNVDHLVEKMKTTVKRGLILRFDEISIIGSIMTYFYHCVIY